ncbi:S1 family peptidase [Duganella aceris]|uniref:Trypsin-like peptidase domain-containing protein n=1 Tax=Duganella aceris TaxID=2703883 RepID=A0ABX0FR03_9BURK|nr:serine protease [Duganella aceris]NGZ87087.1 trypsin-like peptidase domain-containing protein [Duganella aceris]
MKILCCLLLSLGLSNPAAADDLVRAIERIKPSVVGIGSFQTLRTPALSFVATGFVVADGLTVVTAAHVVTDLLANGPPTSLGVLVRADEAAQFRSATVVALDKEHDLARLRIKGTPLPALRLGDSSKVREGQSLAFMGFPLGMVLGLHHATHRCIVSAITPLALPTTSARKLDGKLLNQLQKPDYAVFQLDGTAYPGSSGSPLFDPLTGEVIGVVNMVFVKGIKEAAIAAPSGITYAIPANFIN